MTARRFHAVLRVRAIEKFPGTAVTILSPMWTTVAEHDGTEHADMGGEFSIAICDLGEATPEEAVEIWAARRGWFPFLADVPDRSPPLRVVDLGAVSEAKARLTRLAAALRTANGTTQAIELSAADVRALRGLVVAEMANIAATVADSSMAGRPEAAPEDAALSIIPTSPIDRIAKHLRVPANEEAIQAEITRIHTALGDHGRTMVAWFERVADTLGIHGAPMADVVAAIDLLVAGERAAAPAPASEDRRVIEEVAERLGVCPIDNNVITVLEDVIRRAAEADDGTAPPALPADLDARLFAYCTVAARLGARAGASLTPDEVVSELDEVLKREQAIDDAYEEAHDEGRAPAVDAAAFQERLVAAAADRIAAIMTGLHLERLRTATGMLSRAAAAPPDDGGAWGETIDRAAVDAARDIAGRTIGGRAR